MRMRMLKTVAMVVATSWSSHALAQNIDCSVIRNNPSSLERCLAGQREAAKYEREARKQKKRAALRDGICVADALGGDVAAYAAGWSGRVVYKGTRAAADAISRGASSCPGR